ncbi:SpaA isopeptide-forming pilin-related protein [Streptomyces sp. NPDC004690]
MHTRLVGAVRVAAITAAVTATLTWVPTAHAQPAEPTPPAPTAPTDTPVSEAGSIEVTTTDASGEALAGAAFLLINSTGQEAGRGQTDAQGKVAFPDLAPGVYRLKETASGSPLHDVAADQDVIVTPGAVTRLTVTDPFKAAEVLLQAKDDKTGKFLPGATVNIGTGTGTSTLITLTTGADGTASAELPVSSRRTRLWAKEIKAPAGYDLSKASKTFTANPGASVTVTIANDKTATDPKPDPSGEPTHAPTATSSAADGPSSASGGAKPPAPGESSPSVSAPPLAGSTPDAPAGSLAHTGTDATPWFATGAALLVTAGIATTVAARRRTAARPERDDNGTSG